jgi:uncharacterized protein YjbI with pentapeptide repeats
MIKRILPSRSLVISTILSVIGGLFSGLIGTGIANINLDGDKIANIFCLIEVLIIIGVWLFNSSLQRNKAAILNVLVISIIFLFLSILFGLKEFISRFLLIQFVFVSFTAIAFFLFAFSLSVIDISLRKTSRKNIYYLTSIVFFVGSSALLSHTSLIEIHQKIKSIFSLEFWTAIFLSYIPSFSILISGLVSSKISKSNVDLVFYQRWAIALCTFGNTSFHNKDLSHVDFTNIDLANIDLRAQNFYRTCFRGATGLDRARLDNRYFDIDNPKVQQLLTQGMTIDRNLNGLNLQGAYLKDGRMSDVSLIETNLTGSDLINSDLCNSNLLRANLSGADLQAANLQNCILVQTDLTGANLTGVNLTGACIENWNINGRTNFTDVQCDYIYRKLDETDKPTDRIPLDRDFEPGEFASIYQEVENVVELIFKEGINWRAFAFSLQKLQLDDEGLGLQLRGIEKRGDFWVVKVTHDQSVPSAVVEQKLGAAYETLQLALAVKEQQINQLLGIVTNQSEALKELSKKPFGNQFNITGSTITNLAGSGQIDYTEAANQVRNLVATPSNSSKSNQIAQQLLSQIQNQQLLAPTDREKVELICQIILTESEKDPFFKQFILQQSANLLTAIPEGPIAIAFQTALEILNS